MRSIAALTLILGVSSLLPAQSVPGTLELFPNRKYKLSGSFDTDANAGLTGAIRYDNNKNEMLQMYDSAYFQGIGDMTNDPSKLITAPCQLAGVRVNYIDNEVATKETFVLLCRNESTTTARTPATTVAWGVTVPAFSPPTGTKGAYILSIDVGFATSSGTTNVPIPCQKSFFIGIEVPKSAGTTTNPDGLYLSYSSFGTFPVGGGADFPKGALTAPQMYSFYTGTAFVKPTTWNAVMGVSLLTDHTPTLQVGAVYPGTTTANHTGILGFGAGGMFPEADPTSTRGKSSTDGVALRITSNNYSTGSIAGFFVAFKTIPTPVFYGPFGRLYLFPPWVGPTIVPLTGTDTIVSLVAPNKLPAFNLLKGVSIHFQAVTQTGTNKVLRNSNMAVLTF